MRTVWFKLWIAAPLLWQHSFWCSTVAKAEIIAVYVGVTPSCPYGISACWSGAYGVLSGLEGVNGVAKTPDAYNCTAQVQYSDTQLLPISRWADQFQLRAGKIYGYRGAEVTVRGSIAKVDRNNGNALFLTWKGLDQAIRLASLKTKLQYNFRKHEDRQPEPDEASAYNDLRGRLANAEASGTEVEITGSLQFQNNEPVIEVREFFILKP